MITESHEIKISVPCKHCGFKTTIYHDGLHTKVQSCELFDRSLWNDKCMPAPLDFADPRQCDECKKLCRQIKQCKENG
jgi:hypothetical protein